MKTTNRKRSQTESQSCKLLVRLPVIAFAGCVILSWIGMFVGEWWWGGVGIAVGLVAGDLVDALVQKRVPPNHKP